MPEGEWEEALDRWARAGLISGEQAAAIRTFESARSRTTGAQRPGKALDPFTGTEALVYAGAAAILGGLVYLVASSTSTGGQAAVAIAAGIAGLGGAAALAAGQGPRDVLGSGRRAAAVCAAASIASLAAGLSLLSVARGWLVITMTTCFEPGVCSTSVDRGANAILGAAVALGFALTVLERLRTGILAVLVVASAYTTSLTAVSRLDRPGPTLYSVGAMATGAFLAVVALRAVEVREPLFFTALIVPLTFLFLTDGGDHVGAGGAVAGLAAALALALAVRADSNGLAVAGGLGVFGFCVDLTARSFGGTSPALVLIVSGLALVGCALLVQRALRRNRSAAA